MKTLTQADISDVSEPSIWLNNKLAADSVSIANLESYLNSLQLSLTLLAQECADSDDILAGQYLAQMPALSSDVERMLEETQNASARLIALQTLKTQQERSLAENNPFSEIATLTEAIDKIEVAKKAIKRGKRIFK